MNDNQIEEISAAINNIARSIRPFDTSKGTDATGGTVDSLLEATMGITAGLVEVAHAIHDLANAVRETNQ